MKAVDLPRFTTEGPRGRNIDFDDAPGAKVGKRSPRSATRPREMKQDVPARNVQKAEITITIHLLLMPQIIKCTRFEGEIIHHFCAVPFCKKPGFVR